MYACVMWFLYRLKYICDCSCKEIFIDDVYATDRTDWVLEDNRKESLLEVPLLVFHIHTPSLLWFLIPFLFHLGDLLGMFKMQV